MNFPSELQTAASDKVTSLTVAGGRAAAHAADKAELRGGKAMTIVIVAGPDQ